MSVIVFRRFGGQVPRVHPRLLNSLNAQKAVNAKLWNGKLRAFKRPRFDFETVTPGPILSIYKYRGGGKEGWLHWPVDVDVVKGPLADDEFGRIYFTGNGRPKFADSTTVISVQASLAASASSGANSITVAADRGFAIGDACTINYGAGVTQNVSITGLTPSGVNTMLNFTPATTGALSTANSIVNNSQRYPLASYDLGVPAPTTKLTTTILTGGIDGDEGVEKGDILGISAISLMSEEFQDTGTVLQVQNGDAAWTLAGHVPFHDVEDVESEGYALKLKGSCTVTVRIRSFDEVRDVDFVITRDPEGSAIEAGKNTQHIVRSVMRGAPEDDGIDGVGSYWTYTVSAEAIDNPTDGTYTYRMHFSPTPGLVGADNNSYTVVAKWKFEVEYSNRIQLTLNDGHGLAEGDRITLTVDRAQGTTADKELTGRVFDVLAVDDDKVTISAPSGGVYETGGKWEKHYGTDETADRAYVYTYLAEFNGLVFESAPSPPTSLVTVALTGTVRLTGFINPISPAPLWNTKFVGMRIYRLSASDSIDAQYLFADEVAIGTTQFDDNLLGEALGEVLTTATWLTPPENLQGIIELPEGGAAGFAGKEFCMCVPYYLHAWPVANRRTTHDEIVAIGAFGNSIGIATKGTPWIVTGIDPETVSMERVELIQPCLSKRGAVDLGYAFAYPSPDGLVVLSVGRAEVVTGDLFTPDEWRALNPASFVAANFSGRYLCFYDTGTEKGGFIFDPRDPMATLVFLDFWANTVWADPQNGKVYLWVDGDIREFDADRLELEYRWRSKEVVLSSPTSMGFACVEAASYPVTFTVFADRSPVYTREVFNRDPFRLPAGEFDSWAVEVQGVHEVEAVYVAETADDLTAYEGGS